MILFSSRHLLWAPSIISKSTSISPVGEQITTDGGCWVMSKLEQMSRGGGQVASSLVMELPRLHQMIYCINLPQDVSLGLITHHIIPRLTKYKYIRLKYSSSVPEEHTHWLPVDAYTLPKRSQAQLYPAAKSYLTHKPWRWDREGAVAHERLKNRTQFASLKPSTVI